MSTDIQETSTDEAREDEHLGCDHLGGDCLLEREEGLAPLRELASIPPEATEAKGGGKP